MKLFKSAIPLFAVALLGVGSGAAVASRQSTTTPVVTMSLLKVVQMPSTTASSYSPYVVTKEGRILFFSKAQKFIEGDKVDIFTLPDQEYGAKQRSYKMCLHVDSTVCSLAKLPSREVKRFDETVKKINRLSAY